MVSIRRRVNKALAFWRRNIINNGVMAIMSVMASNVLQYLAA